MLKANILLAAVATLAIAAPASAHRAWFVPSATVLSGTDGWVTVDAAISNDLFYPDHNPMQTSGVKVWAPDGSPRQIQNAATGKYRSVFDVQIDKPGTWRIGTMDTNVGGTFKVNGEDWAVGRRRGPPGGPGGAPGGMAGTGGPPPGGGDGPRGPMIAPGHSVATVAEIPADATDLKLTESSSRNEFYVTSGAPTTTVFQPANTGLEMVPVTHPDELVSNEAARFRFLIDGRPAAGLKVSVIPGGKKFRDNEGAQELTAGADGVVTIKWPVPGIYWMNATATDGRATAPRATNRRMSYTATLEVPAP